MRAALRHLFIVTALGMITAGSSIAQTDTQTSGAVKAKKPVVEARTLDGKKPRGCEFRISIS